MYCPNCKKEYPVDFQGKYCIECGAKLVESPQSENTGVNIGGEAAIMGGLNVTTNESHNTTTYDQRVINTKTVTNNIVEREKSEFELRNERNAQFMELCKQVLSDGLMAEEEKQRLTAERVRLGLDETEAARLIEIVRKTSGVRMATLGTRDTMTLKSIDRYLESNNRIVLGGQIPRLKALVQNYKIEEVLYKYYMLLAALRPDELVKEYESNVADEYWQTYWVAIAYMKLNKVAEAEGAIVKLGLYPSYPEHNALLLSAVGTLAELGVEDTSSYVAAVNPEQCSHLLAPFVHALYFEVVPERAKSVGARRENCLFYIENIVSLESPEEKEAKRKAEEEAKRKAAEEEARRKAEEAKRKAEEDARRKAAEEAKRKVEEDARRKAAEDAKRKAEEDARCKAAEDARRKAEEAAEDARRKAEEDARRKAAEDAKRKAEEDARRKIAEDARRKAEDARRKAAEDARRKAEEDARRKAAEDAKRKAEEAKRKAEEEAAAKRKKRNMWLAIAAIFVVALFVIPGLFGDDKDAAIEEGSATMIRTIEEESTIEEKNATMKRAIEEENAAIKRAIEEENAAMKRAIEEKNAALSEWEKIVSGSED